MRSPTAFENIGIAIIISFCAALISPDSDNVLEDTVAYMMFFGIVSLMVVLIKYIFQKFRKNWSVIYRDTVIIMSLFGLITIVANEFLYQDLDESFLQQSITKDKYDELSNLNQIINFIQVLAYVSVIALFIWLSKKAKEFNKQVKPNETIQSSENKLNPNKENTK